MEGLLKNKKKKENQDMQSDLNTLWKVGRLCMQTFIYWSILLQALRHYLARGLRDGGQPTTQPCRAECIKLHSLHTKAPPTGITFERSKASSQWLTGSPFSIESWGIFICFCCLGAVLLSGSGCRCRVMLMRTVLADMFYFIASFWPLHTFFALYSFCFCILW